MTLAWETIATATTASGPLELRRRGEKDFLITLRGRVLMSSAAHRSEDALAKLACAGLQKKRRAHVLVSGLGMVVQPPQGLLAHHGTVVQTHPGGPRHLPLAAR